MNKQLEQLFNLDTAESFALPEEPHLPEPVESLTGESVSLEDRIDRALPQIKGVDTSDIEVDHIAEEAMKTYQEIKDLALNVEPRHSAELLAVAAQLLKTALDAKQGKTKDKLAAVRLQISASALMKKAKQEDGVTEVEGKVVGNRNQIVAAMKNSKDPAK